MASIRTPEIPRRAFMASIAGGLLAAPLAAGAQPIGKVARVGFLAAGSGSDNQSYLNAFRQGLSELGYVEGRSIAIEYRWGEGNYEGLPKLAAELVHLKVDVKACDRDDPHRHDGR